MVEALSFNPWKVKFPIILSPELRQGKATYWQQNAGLLEVIRKL